MNQSQPRHGSPRRSLAKAGSWLHWTVGLAVLFVAAGTHSTGQTVTGAAARPPANQNAPLLVLSPKATFPVAARLRGEGVPIGDLFAHMSGLYFRGKITYARKFGRAFVITPDQGLVPAETAITLQVLMRFADAEIDPDRHFRLSEILS